MDISSHQGGFEFLSSLSYDAMLEVLDLLTVQELGRFAQVSKESHAIACDDVVWRRLCRGLEVKWSTLINRPVSMAPKIHHSDNWRESFHQERDRMMFTSKFLGSWSEKWCDVNVIQSTTIDSDGTNFIVSYQKNKFSATFRGIEGDCFSFHLEGGDSGWSFVYQLRPLSDSVLHLTVNRVHDQKNFSGVFTRNAFPNDTPAPTMQMELEQAPVPMQL